MTTVIDKFPIQQFHDSDSMRFIVEIMVTTVVDKFPIQQFHDCDSMQFHCGDYSDCCTLQ